MKEEVEEDGGGSVFLRSFTVTMPRLAVPQTGPDSSVNSLQPALYNYQSLSGERTRGLLQSLSVHGPDTLRQSWHLAQNKNKKKRDRLGNADRMEF